MKKIPCMVAFAIAALILASCGGSSGSDEEDDPTTSPSVFAGTWLSQDASHSVKAIIDSSGIPIIYVNDGSGTYNLASTYASPLSYDASAHRIALPDSHHSNGSNLWSGSFSADGKSWVKSGIMAGGRVFYACVGGSTATGLGTWTSVDDECNDTNSRWYRKISFTVAATGSTTINLESQSTPVGGPAGTPYTASGDFTVSDWTNNGDGTGSFRISSSTLPAIPNGVYPFVVVGDAILFGLDEDPSPTPLTLDSAKIFVLAKQ